MLQGNRLRRVAGLIGLEPIKAPVDLQKKDDLDSDWILQHGDVPDPESIPLEVQDDMPGRTGSRLLVTAAILTAEQIHKAAIRAPDGTIFEGVAHFDAWMKATDKLGDFDPSEEDQGFTTTEGRFVSRKEALDIARGEKQVKPEDHLWGGEEADRLHSEDVPHLKDQPSERRAM